MIEREDLRIYLWFRPSKRGEQIKKRFLGAT